MGKLGPSLAPASHHRSRKVNWFLLLNRPDGKPLLLSTAVHAQCNPETQQGRHRNADLLLRKLKKRFCIILGSVREPARAREGGARKFFFKLEATQLVPSVRRHNGAATSANGLCISP